MSAIAKTRSSSSISTSAYYNGDDQDTADSVVAEVLTSLSSSSSKRIYVPVDWGATKKRTNRFLLVKRVMNFYEFFKSTMGGNIDISLKALKVMFKSNKEILAGLESIQYLRSEGLDRDQIVEVVKEVVKESSKKRKVEDESDKEKEKERCAPINMRTKKIKIVKSNVLESVGEDDMGESVKGYPCSECNEVFSSFQALGGHTASHNRKKKAEEAIGVDNGGVQGSGLVAEECNLCPKSFSTAQGEDGNLRGSVESYECKECKEVFSSSQALRGHTASHKRKKKFEEAIGNDKGGGEVSGLVVEERKSVHKCNLCPRSFPTGQALGGHKTSHNEKKKGSSIEKRVVLDFDLNVAPVDHSFESFSSSQFHSNLSLLC
ncbi:Zinc finger protein ZAT6 [Euphorbia peplus]|nr:Zinc finger protein ZAT6 [Euphorbia peplus]